MRFRTRPYPEYAKPATDLGEARRRADEAAQIRLENLEAIRNAARLRLAMILAAPILGILVSFLLTWWGRQ